MKATLLIVCGLCLNLFGGELPADAAALKAKRDAKVAEIDSAYLGALSKLRDGYLAKGELSKAEAVSNEIFGGEKATPPRLSCIVGKWRRDYDKKIIEFIDDSSGIYDGETRFTVSYNPSTKLITMTSSKWVDTVELTLHKDVLRGGHNNKIPYKLERVK